MTQTTATKYARILWELQIPQDSIRETLSLFKENPDLLMALRDPMVHLEDKVAVVDRVIPEEMRNFIKVLCKNRCVLYYEQIVEEYRIWADNHDRIVYATLTYVTPPSEEQMEGIRKFLCKRYDAVDVDMQEFTDPSLMGGFILTAGDQEYDWSLRGRIEALERKLAGGEDR